MPDSARQSVPACQLLPLLSLNHATLADFYTKALAGSGVLFLGHEPNLVVAASEAEWWIIACRHGHHTHWCLQAPCQLSPLSQQCKCLTTGRQAGRHKEKLARTCKEEVVGVIRQSCRIQHLHERGMRSQLPLSMSKGVPYAAAACCRCCCLLPLLLLPPAALPTGQRRIRCHSRPPASWRSWRCCSHP